MAWEDHFLDKYLEASNSRPSSPDVMGADELAQAAKWKAFKKAKEEERRRSGSQSRTSSTSSSSSMSVTSNPKSEASSKH
ncbi:uncharacterized protein LTR77_006733 [Saxophila tyrrhenica]|uniref:Uncharacterized protein n=1 Tax=Saxophila tyrrhenica TaxID=1690608 RepID=A0AAV9P922_9PEZI|nr:hypothetical protein LTR77_006733 [Saxophila tyrrhenica]